MRTPAFWYPGQGGTPWQARLLAPLGLIYAQATRRRLRRGPLYQAGVPIICVGNINAGGTGKTPTVIALAEHLLAKGMRPMVLSRGYGGRVRGPLLVDPAEHSAADIGDEPLLMSAFSPVWVAEDRVAGAKAAEAAGADVILFDDGFQDPAVVKTVSLVVVDARAGFGNGHPIPAGPLREPVSAGLARASAIVSIGEVADQTAFSTNWESKPSLPRLEATLEPLQTGLAWRGLPVLAFAGIGHPEKFFRLLRKLEADTLLEVPLGDHQPLTPTLMARLEAEATARGAQLVTTEKDAVRLPSRFRQKVVTLPVRLRFHDLNQLDSVLRPVLPR